MNEIKDFYDEVARVAYELYGKRGQVHGYDMEDWLEAEIIVKERYAKETEHEATVIKSPSGTK